MNEQSDSPMTPVEALLDWLIKMDDPDSESGMQARQTVTLTRIIERARDTQRWIDLAKTTSPEALPYDPDSGPRLWEVDHPFYGCDDYENHVDTFDELREHVDSMDEDMNLVYRWDWKDYSQPHFDDDFLTDAERRKQKFIVFWLMPRKGRCGSISCSITHEQEAEVYEWLSGPRCLGHLQKVWAPLLGQITDGGAR